MRSTVLLIGNGPSADTPAVVAAMERADLVLRMNNWQPGKHTGDRCDIWGTSYNVDVPDRLAKEIWWTTWPYGTAPQFNYELTISSCRRRHERAAPKELLDGLYGRYKPKHPSTGIILAAMASVVFHGRIALAGFDFFSAGQHHYWTNAPAIDDPMKWHNPDVARQFIAELQARGAEMIS